MDRNMSGPRKILVAVKNSTTIVDEAIRLMDRNKAWLTALKVFPTYEGELHLTGITNIRHVIDAGREKFITDIKKMSAGKRALIKIRYEYGDIATKILQVAEEENSDLIVMGCRPKNRFKKIICGDLVNQIRKRALCPILEISRKENEIG